MSGIQVPDMFYFEKCQIWQEHIMDHEPFFLPRSGLKLDIMVNVDTEIEIDFKIGAKQASNQIAAPAKSIFCFHCVLFAIRLSIFRCSRFCEYKCVFTYRHSDTFAFVRKRKMVRHHSGSGICFFVFFKIERM